MNTLDFDLELKEVGEDGTLKGYGAVFNNVDLGGDRLMPGAFAETLARHAKAGTMPVMLWQHQMDKPIGILTDMKEDRRGLAIAGKLVLETIAGREAWALSKAGAVRGLSMGYRTVKSQQVGNVRQLIEVDLSEISMTPFPMNESARVTSVKEHGALAEFARRLRDGEPPQIKEFEDILREAGVPKALAVQIASVGYAKAVRSESEGKASDAALIALRDAVRAFNPQT